VPVVTIARQLGSLGDEIGRALAERLRYRYLDQPGLLDHIREFGEIRPDAPGLTETRPSFWERLSDERRRLTILATFGVYSFARADDAVILGLRSSFLLRDLSHVLRVLTVAPLPVRAERVMAATARGPGPVDRAAALELIQRSDRERGGYNRYMHKFDWTDVHGYDLVLNTADLTVEQAVHVIASALERAQITPTAGSLQRIDDLTLASRVEASLVSSPEIWVGGLKATAEGGVVAIAGEVITDEDRERAEELARGVAGVRAVVNEIRIQPPPQTGM
jgi:hypothetical protein